MLYFTIADAMPSKKEFLKTPFFPLSDDIQSNNDHFSKTNLQRSYFLLTRHETYMATCSKMNNLCMA